MNQDIYQKKLVIHLAIQINTMHLPSCIETTNIRTSATTPNNPYLAVVIFKSWVTVSSALFQPFGEFSDHFSASPISNQI